jgi:hypothetical protein
MALHCTGAFEETHTLDLAAWPPAVANGKPAREARGVPRRRANHGALPTSRVTMTPPHIVGALGSAPSRRCKGPAGAREGARQGPGVSGTR